MRRTRSHLLLIVSLLFGLWMSAAHSAEHLSTLAGHEACEVCIFNSGLGSGLQLAPASLPFLTRDTPDALKIEASMPVASVPLHHARGPPRNFA